MAIYRSDELPRQIKERLTAERVSRRYGFEPSRSGYISCPFHLEKTASLKLYPGQGGWHCFGCGAGGTVIDFVMRLFGLSFPQALLRLNEDFDLGLTGRKPTRQEATEAVRRRQQETDELVAYRTVYEAKNARFKILWEAKKQGPDDPLYAAACRELDALDDWFLTHPWR